MYKNLNLIRVVSITLFLAVLLTVVILLINYQPSPIFIILLVAVVVGLYLMVHHHAENTYYSCKSCGDKFKVSTLVDFTSPHTPEKKLLKCPRCGHVDWCQAE